MNQNLILDTDSYKASHWLQYPPGTDGLFAYIESRGGEYDKTLFFGLQYILKHHFSAHIDEAMIQEAKEVFAAHGEPFNEAGWRYVLEKHGGRLPLEIKALPEGSFLPTGNVLVTVESTDPEVFWLASYVETMLMRLWYPLTVATQSHAIKGIIRDYLRDTSDDPEGQLLFKLHDFGSRGVSSQESAGIGGMAHLVNFRGTDTVVALRYARDYYGEPMAGYSIPAAEHSTITSWGREGEVEAYRNMIRRFGGEGKIFACVSDSYDLYTAVEKLWGGALKEEVLKSGATVVIRPDSGHPAEVAVRSATILDRTFGSTVNSKGYKVLNKVVRIIYGDGINRFTIREILANLKLNGYAADNVAFGMGGALLQQVNRDTQRMAMKTSAAHVDGVWRDVFKDPVTDPGKASKRGRLMTWTNGAGDWRTSRLEEPPTDNGPWTPALETVWRNGHLLRDESLRTIRERADG